MYDGKKNNCVVRLIITYYGSLEDWRCKVAREINEIIVRANEKPRLIEELLYKHDKFNYMSSIDLVVSFLQIPLEKTSRKYTTFIFEGEIMNLSQYHSVCQ